jgi:hypothetical protein
MATRAELNDQAAELGIDNPGGLANKAAVEDAIARNSTPLRDLKVVDAVEDELRNLIERDADLARSPLAATCFALASQLDDSKNSATSKSMCAKALNETLERLWDLAPDKEEKDGVDDLTDRRKARIARSAAATN